MFGKGTLLADLQLFESFSKNGQADELELQVRLCRTLGLAFALSVAGLGGIGSLLALVLGIRGRKIIKHSHGRFGGIWLAWLCIVSGALGTLISPPTIGMLVWRSLK